MGERQKGSGKVEHGAAAGQHSARAAVLASPEHCKAVGQAAAGWSDRVEAGQGPALAGAAAGGGGNGRQDQGAGRAQQCRRGATDLCEAAAIAQGQAGAGNAHGWP